VSAGVVIIGGGQAGLETAAALRSQSYQGPITIVCEEPHEPYQRPPLSKDFLAGKASFDHLALRGAAFYQNHHIGLVIGQRAVAIDRAAKRVRLAAGDSRSGDSLPYDTLVLAVGARNRALLAPGAEHVLYLRTVDESEAIKQRLSRAQRVAVIGGGFIGLEIAAVARSAGKAVAVIEAKSRLMPRAAAPPLSDFFLDVHRTHGVEVILNAAAAEVRPDAVVLRDGRKIEADLVIAGIGIEPNAGLARDAGLEVGDGIAVNAFMQTSDPAIYAVGDCTDHPNPFAGGRTRLESVQNAVDQAKCAARAICGKPSPYADVPWFWTDQYDIRFQMVGLCTGYDRSVVRGSIENRKFSVFYFKDGRLLAVDSVNRFGDHIAARKMLATGKLLTPEQAADEAVDLKKLAGGQGVT
jgi:3-phenylpropionate/trans-cinnamate dioxygenase ferredoxin reductase subunit